MPLYERLFQEFLATNPNVQIRFECQAGSKAFTNLMNGTLDFVTTTPDMISSVTTALQSQTVAFPIAASAIVIAYNLTNVPELRISREAYVGIILGRVKTWNDLPLRRYNRQVSLPDQPIQLILNAEPSDTALAVSQHLAAISPEFAQRVGISRYPQWPVGSRINGEEAVAAAVRSTPGSVAFLDRFYAQRHELAIARVQNWADSFVLPTTGTVHAALSTAVFPRTTAAWVGDPRHEKGYPLVRYIWVVCRKLYGRADKLVAVRSFLEYCTSRGRSTMENTDFFPLASNLLERAKEQIATFRLEDSMGQSAGEPSPP